MIIKTRHGNLIFDKKTIVMGILNMTPDSFSDGGDYFNNIGKAVLHVEQMLKHGADIIDIGGESTKPGADKISPSEELQRVIPTIKKLRGSLGDNFIISIDTYKSEVAKEAYENGADILNEVSGLQMDPQIPITVAKIGIPIIINHMNGTPKTMQLDDISYKDVILDIKDFFEEKIKLLKNLNYDTKQIILDPGFGFGKTVENNFTILKRFKDFQKFNLPLMIGVSRKNSLGSILKEDFKREFLPKERMEASLAATAIAVLNGANIIRTHDILETKKFLSIIDHIKQIA